MTGEVAPSPAGARLARRSNHVLHAVDPFDVLCLGDGMTKSATDIVQEVINAAVVDAIVALKDASQGLPNALIRDLASIHANTAFTDLPPAVQKAVAASVRNAFSLLQKAGYVVAEARSVAPV